VPFDPELLGYTALWHRANGATSMHELLERGVEFDAVFGLNDTLALGAMRVLQEAGRRVPDDVAVIGFDDLDEARYSLPSLTTVDPGRVQIARTAVDVLVDRIAGVDTEPRHEIFADFRIVERESSGQHA
jgi:DNA-binding LacI/PurR family transcriptional regulator